MKNTLAKHFYVFIKKKKHRRKDKIANGTQNSDYTRKNRSRTVIYIKRKHRWELKPMRKKVMLQVHISYATKSYIRMLIFISITKFVSTAKIQRLITRNIDITFFFVSILIVREMLKNV